MPQHMPVDTLQLGSRDCTHKPRPVLMDSEYTAQRNLAGPPLLPFPRCELQLLQSLQGTLDGWDHMNRARWAKLGLRDDDLLAVEVHRGPSDPVLLAATDARPERDVQFVDAMLPLLLQHRLVFRGGLHILQQNLAQGDFLFRVEPADDTIRLLPPVELMDGIDGDLLLLFAPGVDRREHRPVPVPSAVADALTLRSLEGRQPVADLEGTDTRRRSISECFLDARDPPRWVVLVAVVLWISGDGSLQPVA